MTDRMRQRLGAYRLTVRSAAPELLLSRLTRERLYFWDLRRIDDFTVALTVRRRDLAAARAWIDRAMGEITETRELGMGIVLRRIWRRKVFFAAVALILLSMQVFTAFVWHVQVEGNETVPDEQILRELEDLGVGFGTWGLSIVPQTLKNQMLVRIPKLEWLTVVRSGGLATAVVRERPEEPAVIDRRTVSNLVAVRDCLITEMQVLSGQAVREAGDTVRAGELLISGYADLEYCTQATRALGEVYGRTWYDCDAVTPAEMFYQTDVGQTHRRYALLLGRKRINFYKDSGIWGDGCDKMVTYHPLTLPGGLELPLTLVEETAVERTLEPGTVFPAEAAALLEDGREAAVRQSMVAGEVVRRDTDVRREGAVYRLQGVYECREMVAREVPAILLESEGST